MVRNKKGSSVDLVMIGVILLVFSIAIIIGFKISNELNDKFQASDQLDTHGKSAFNQINNMYPGIVDNSFLFLTVGLTLGALMMSVMIRVHPIFLVFFLMFWFIIIFLSAVFSNIFQEIASNPAMADVASQLTFTRNVMFILPWFTAIIGGLLAIVMYKNFKQDSEF